MKNNPGSKAATLSLSFSDKLNVVAELFKFRLNIMVVSSSVLGYFIGMDSFNWMVLLSLMVGGFLVTGASNAMNQIIEKDLDAKMDRTSGRPLPTYRTSPLEAWIISLISGVTGILMLWFLVNPLTAILAGLSLFVYVILYTPLKRITGFSVFVGAFPGAIPPMLGYVAATGAFGLEAGLLFAIQFMWQFPHFWAIAWHSNDDYNKAGFRMLPSAQGKTNYSAFVILLYTFMLLPVSITPVIFGMAHWITGLVIFLFGIGFAYPAVKLYFTGDDKDARTLMFASFLYLPLTLIALFIDKLI